MIRGRIKFKCDKCGHTFEDFDIEWRATAYSQPMKCPNCGSYHTMPKSILWFLHRIVYKKIWNDMDEQQESR